MSVSVDQFGGFNPETLRVEVDNVSNNLTIVGQSREINPSTGSPVWLIKKITSQSKDLIRIEYASQKFDQIWDNRDTIFNVFRNTTSILLDGVNDHVLLGDVTELSFDGTSPFSISVWFRSTFVGTQEKILFSKQGANFASGYRLSIQDNALFFHISGGSANNRIEVESPTLSINNNDWHNAIITYDGSQDASGVSIYFDTELQGLALNSDNLSNSADNSIEAQYAGRNGTTAPFLGFMDELSAWNKELSPVEVDDIYSGGVPGDLALHSAGVNNVGWWRHDGDIFPTIVDQGSNTSNDGTMINMTSTDLVGEVPE